MIEIVALDAAATHPLRRTVLRTGTRSEVVEFDGDDESTTVHLGVRIDGELVAISTWLARRYPDRPHRPAFQLRGMATDPAHRCHGHADRLVDAGVAHCVAEGAELVWARARVDVLEFYRRRGFEPVGPEYVDLTTGLPHRDIVRVLVG